MAWRSQNNAFYMDLLPCEIQNMEFPHKKIKDSNSSSLLGGFTIISQFSQSFHSRIAPNHFPPPRTPPQFSNQESISHQLSAVNQLSAVKPNQLSAVKPRPTVSHQTAGFGFWFLVFWLLAFGFWLQQLIWEGWLWLLVFGILAVGFCFLLKSRTTRFYMVLSPCDIRNME